jgi:hypothetical protein
MKTHTRSSFGVPDSERQAGLPFQVRGWDSRGRFFVFMNTGKNIIRIVGDKPFAMIDRKSLEDDRLSWTAKGILCYLQTKPEMEVEDLWMGGTETIDEIESAISELHKLGYVEMGYVE